MHFSTAACTMILDNNTYQKIYVINFYNIYDKVIVILSKKFQILSFICWKKEIVSQYDEIH